jgi:V8-like Glu-specific endopeptidase
VLNLRVNPLDRIVERRATSSLLTNEKLDGKPFLLTAYHVVKTAETVTWHMSEPEKEELQYWLFIFNYQSSSCDNPTTEPTLAYSISGATYLAGRSAQALTDATDFALLQLNQKPPKNFNAYYNGWSNDKDDMTETGVSISHPKYDIKKIAEWKKTSSGLDSDIWAVNYTKGGIQNGSSGSPLFNSSGFVVGQLSLGNFVHPCGPKSKGKYGRFYKSWKYGLEDYLNPTHEQYHLISMPGDETCKPNWVFNNCDDLHTSDNVGIALFGAVRQYDGVYNAKDYISAENTTIQANTTVAVVFEAGNEIILKPGFHAKSGSIFTAKIGDCELGCINRKNVSESLEEMVIKKTKNTQTIEKIINTANIEDFVRTQEFLIYPNPNHGVFSIKLSDDKSELQKIIITDARGTIVYNNSDYNIVTNVIQLPNPAAGIYIISLFFKDKILTSKFAVL